MARMARAVAPGLAHHITQRGNRGERIFFSDADRRRYLKLLREYATGEGLEILGYCLMSNHVHLVAVPDKSETLVRVFKPLNLRFAWHVNRRQGWTGRLWQERFYSCALDERHCLQAVRYVEMNPVRARMVQRPEKYYWSSAQGHVGLRIDPLLSDRQRHLSGVDDWSAWLREPLTDEDVAGLRLSTTTGRPLGSAAFITRLESKLGRDLRARPRGRPRLARDREKS
jgi:putative transposase